MEDNQQVRVLLWCVPRSCSTAFMRVIENCRPGKVKVLDELYYKSYYLSEDRRSDRYVSTRNHRNVTDCQLKTEQCSYSCRLSLYEESYSDYDVVFGKEMSLFLGDILDSNAYIPKGYQHTFLIRHPKRTIPSLYKCFIRSGTISMEDVKSVAPEGKYMYKATRDLFNHLKARGDTPIVIDTEDLLNNPVGVFQAYCSATQLPFRTEMLNWEKETVQNKWAKHPEWYGALVHSTCFGQIQTKDSESLYKSNNNINGQLQKNLDKLDDIIQEQIANNLPLYEDLYKFRLQVSYA